MTVDQLLADLRLRPGRDLVVYESARVVALVTGVSSNRVHLANVGVEPHYADECDGCARGLALVSAVSLLSLEDGR
jgi:hypothetical protein